MRQLGNLSKVLSLPRFDKQKQIADIQNMTHFFPSQRGWLEQSALRVCAQVIGPFLDFLEATWSFVFKKKMLTYRVVRILIISTKFNLA